MAIEVVCCKCGEELKELGALVFGPPDPGDFDRTDKYHVCVVCYETVLLEALGV
jgi:hypothetical protein